ncbi:uncharacterized protein CC84DRAFT_803072 [Paraphaeosphaeria sporulosa]|uniref:Uncharacterized protein n=1 Tax=Paraphaeosphaeria sporulosa TaxID=1460663 RepID=A0A177CBT3_9PLEO|nr:uncharacterized protein CC84DRAFT_803072 [Paraphaeosphaeria sporulosa]OAG04786.1 hypothetical protein CC84DRAFT_803072 [Paraphaeosphaeria sporulosa]
MPRSDESTQVNDRWLIICVEQAAWASGGPITSAVHHRPGVTGPCNVHQITAALRPTFRVPQPRSTTEAARPIDYLVLRRCFASIVPLLYKIRAFNRGAHASYDFTLRCEPLGYQPTQPAASLGTYERSASPRCTCAPARLVSGVRGASTRHVAVAYIALHLDPETRSAGCIHL